MIIPGIILPKIPGLNSISDWLFIGFTLVFLLGSWGLIVLCDRLMEDAKRP
jgi:hypothetical protein